MRRFCVVLLLAALALPAAGQKCSGGKCVSPAKLDAFKKKAMLQRRAQPRQLPPAVFKINQQIVALSRTNVRGRNNAQIRGLQAQRNQILKASLNCR